MLFERIGQAQDTRAGMTSGAALRAAIIRGVAPRGSNPRPPAMGNRAQLERLGLTPEAVDLLNATGGTNA